MKSCCYYYGAVVCCQSVEIVTVRMQIRLSLYLFIYYKIVHTVQDRQNGQSNIKKWHKSEVRVK